MDLTARNAKLIRSLRQKKNRDEQKVTLVEGERAIVSVLSAGAEVVFMVSSDGDVRDRALKATNYSGPVAMISAREMKTLTDITTPPGILAVVKFAPEGISEFLNLEKVLVLDAVQDPGNVGTIIRTCAWFGIDGIIAGPGTADFYSPKVVRSTAGALWSMRLSSSADLAADLNKFKLDGWSVVTATMNGSDYRTISMPPKGILVLGNEANGITPEVLALSTRSIGIPGKIDSAVDSLNVAVAAAILIAAW